MITLSRSCRLRHHRMLALQRQALNALFTRLFRSLSANGSRADVEI